MVAKTIAGKEQQSLSDHLSLACILQFTERQSKPPTTCGQDEFSYRICCQIIEEPVQWVNLQQLINVLCLFSLFHLLRVIIHFRCFAMFCTLLNNVTHGLKGILQLSYGS